MFGLHKPGESDEQADQRHSNHIMIWISLGVLLVGVLAWRAAKAGSQAQSIGYPGNTPTGGGSSGDGVGGLFANFNQQLASLQSDLADVEAKTMADTSAISAQQATTETTVTNLTDKLKQSLDTLSKLGAQTDQNTQVTSSLSQSSSSGIAGLPSALIDQLRRNGEYVTDSVRSTTGGELFLTNKGGVYTSEGANFFGSYLGYANKTSNPGAEIAGHGDFSHGDIDALANGFYTIRNNNGENYTFNNETKAAGF